MERTLHNPILAFNLYLLSKSSQAEVWKKILVYYSLTPSLIFPLLLFFFLGGGVDVKKKAIWNFSSGKKNQLLEYDQKVLLTDIKHGQ